MLVAMDMFTSGIWSPNSVTARSEGLSRFSSGCEAGLGWPAPHRLTSSEVNVPVTLFV